jgi:copper chaperone
METLKFKTNVQCGGCIATITPHLDNLPKIGYWDVDTLDPGKILTVQSEHLPAGEIIAALKNAGYRAEQI